MSASPPSPAATSATDDAVRTVSFVSLGCPKNLVDSEKMLGLLAEDGLVPVPDDEACDAIVINTCGFLEASKDESMQEIQQAAERKRAGEIKRLIVAGCLVQRHRAKLLEWCPDIDALIGVFDRDKIVEAVAPQRNAADRKDVAVELPVYSSIAANATIAKAHRRIEADGYFEDDSARLRLTPRHYAFVRMSEGCNQNCAFCTIPSIRGKMRSKPVEKIQQEIRELVADGAYEINLIGQDTTSYGMDIGYDGGLTGLLESLDDTMRQATSGQGGWLRLMYAYPSKFTDEMIDAIARLSNVCKYIDMPLQHINDQVLDRMRRHTSRKLIETLLDKLRNRVSGIAIRTTFISGFPGETNEQHEELVDFVRDFGFEAMGVFPYSPEPGTVAGRLYGEGDAVPNEVIEQRIEELMLTQQDVCFAKNEARANAGEIVDVLIDEDTGQEVQATPGVTSGGRLYEGRTVTQAPDIDATTKVVSAQTLSPGEVASCQITAYAEYDLIAVPVADLSKNVALNVIG